MEVKGIALSRLALLMMIVVVFFGVLMALYAYGNGPDVDINMEAQCTNSLEADIASSNTGVTEIPDDCFGPRGEPVISSLSGAEPGDSVKKVNGEYEVVSQ